MTHPSWILLRGLARECRYWGYFPKQLATRLNAQVQCPELYGNGIYHQQKSATFIADMVDQLRREVTIRRPVYLLGLSMGGMIAIEWAARYPREVAGLALVNSSSTLNPFWLRLRPKAQLGVGLALLMSRAQRERLIYRLTCNYRHDSDTLLPGWIHYANQYPTAHSNFVRQLVAAARYRVPASNLPVNPLVLCGLQDHLVNPLCSQTLAQHLRVSLHQHPRAGHDLLHDDPDWLLSKLARYSDQQGLD